MALGELVGPLIVGALVDTSKGYYLPGLVFGGCVITAGGLCMCAGPVRAIKNYDCACVKRSEVADVTDAAAAAAGTGDVKVGREENV